MTYLRKYMVAVLIPIMLMLGCSSASNDAARSVSFTVISEGSNFANGTIDAKIVETYLDQVSYDSAVNQYSLPTASEIIDFTFNQVVLVTMGSQSSGGHVIAAESVRDAGDYIELRMILSSPGFDCATTSAFTYPYQVLKINSRKEVRTVERNVTESCG